MAAAHQRHDWVEQDSNRMRTLIEDGNLDAIRSAIRQNRSLLNQPLDRSGVTPLMEAIRLPERSVEIIEFLVRSGADVNAQTVEGYTPLHLNIDLAYGTGGTGEAPYRIARLLKESGADAERTNHYGWTPLMRAALEGTADEFRALLEIGARWDVNYPAQSMPVFTRGRSLVSIILHNPDFLRAILDSGFKPGANELEDIARQLKEASDPGSRYSKGLVESRNIIEKSLRAV